MLSSARLALAVLGALLLGCAALPSAAAEPTLALPSGVGPHGTVGWETLRRLDLLPYLATGSQTRQFSSFDRSGGDFDRRTGNKNGSGGCLRRGGVGCVIAEDAGAGEVDSIWFTRDRGVVTKMGRIRIELDGRRVLDAPLQSVVDGDLGAPFVFPLVANGDQSPGGVYLKVPMPYRESMRISVESDLQYYHVTYRHFTDADGIATFDPADRATDVLAMLRAGGDPMPRRGGVADRRTVEVPGYGSTPLAAPLGSGLLSGLRLHLPGPVGSTMAGLRLRIAFDGRDLVDAPLGEFFGAGLGAADVRSLMFSATPDGDLTAWWPMPFAVDAVVTLVNTTPTPVRGVASEVDYAPDPTWAVALASGRAGYFTARSHAGPTVPGEDWVFADETGHGKFVGVSETMRGTGVRTVFSDSAPYFLEGAERVYVDGSRSPQIYGTGTEDFYEGGWYFRGGTVYSDVFTGQPAKRTTGPGCPGYCVATYRLMPDEAVEYRSALRFGMEHGKRNMVTPDYSSTAFLYTQFGDTVSPGDQVVTGDAVSRAVHGYADTGAAESGLTSEYEGTADQVPVSGAVRAATGPITFRLLLRPDNRGVLLRRTCDQAQGYQSADVAVDGVPVGTWLQARANPIHRWLDDSFPLPARVTGGKIAVTITVTPTPGSPPWTAASYRADALVG